MFLGQISWAGRAVGVHPQNLHPFAEGVSSLVLRPEPGSPHPVPSCLVWSTGEQPDRELLSQLILSQHPPPLKLYYRLLGELAN